MKAIIEANRNNYDEKITKLIEDLKAMIISTITSMMDQSNIYKSSPAHKYSPKPPDPNTVVLAKNRDPPLDGGHSMKIGGMKTIKHDISSPKFYELLVKTEIKGYNSIDLNNFYNHINMCLNKVTRL